MEGEELEETAEAVVPGARVHVFRPDGYARESAAWIGERMRRAATYRDRVTLALAGGRAPEPVYEALARIRGLPWGRVEIYFSDERAVPPDAEGSNYRMARERLLSRVPVPEDRVHRMEAEDEDLDAAARRYEEILPDPFDLLLLEIGEEGRVASLFPRSPALVEERRVASVAGPGELRDRLTVTPPVLTASRVVAVMARGRETSGPVAAALGGEGPVEECPARLARGDHWLVDADAAAGLQPGAI